jgi:large subunit ribosomal protein L5
MSEEGTKVVEKNPMEKVRIEKVIVHMSIGSDWDRLQKAAKLLEELTGQKPIYRLAKKTIRAFGITRKKPISTMVTLRGERAIEFLKKAFDAVEYRLKSSSFDEYGNFAFGIKEHLFLPGTKYDPKIGIFGMDIIVHLSKPGLRVSKRRYRKSRVGKGARVSREEAIQFVKDTFGVEVV